MPGTGLTQTMANEYYSPDARRADKVNALFSRIAHRYDLINDLQSFGLHRSWKRRVVGMAKARMGQRALDVCCGTGDLAFSLSKAGAQTVGLDFTEAMLQVALRRAEQQAGRPIFLRGDAQALPFPGSTFDIVTVGYGLRNLADWKAGLSEMLRVTRPGGRILVLDFGKPDNTLWRALYFGYLRAFVPLLGLLACGSASAYAYILESLLHYPAQRGVEKAMRELGMTQVKVENILGGVMSVNVGVKAVP